MECCSHQTSHWLTLFMCSQLFYDVIGRSNQSIYKFIDMVHKWWFRGIIMARCGCFVAMGSDVMDLVSCLHIQLDCISQQYCCVTNHPKTLALTTIICCYSSYVCALAGGWLLQVEDSWVIFLDSARFTPMFKAGSWLILVRLIWGANSVLHVCPPSPGVSRLSWHILFIRMSKVQVVQVHFKTLLVLGS